METISCLVLVEKDVKEELGIYRRQINEATEEEIKEVLLSNDGDLERLGDFTKLKDCKVVWGYLCKVGDFFRHYVTDMDKVLLFVDSDNEAYSYEHTGNVSTMNPEELKVVGLMDENAEIEAVRGVF